MGLPVESSSARSAKVLSAFDETGRLIGAPTPGHNDDNGSYTPISRLAFLAATDTLSNSVTTPDSSHAAEPLRQVVEKRNTARLSKSRAVLYP
jgi:hypothetical protein